MHLSTAAQAQAHVDIVTTALARVWASLPPILAHEAPSAERYRTRARFAVRATRGKVWLGYRPKASHAIEQVRSCSVLHARLEALLDSIAAAFESEEGHGELSLGLGRDGVPVLDLTWDRTPTGKIFRLLEEGVGRKTWAGATVRSDGATRPAIIGDPRVWTIGGDGEPLMVPSGGFAQAHPAMNQRLAERANALLPVDGADVIELFAGSGNFSVLVARTAQSFVAVESEPDAVQCARANLAARKLAGRVVEADADAFPIPTNVRVAWLDPPRTGARGAASAIAASRVRRIAYVSCDPATLARDAAILATAGFEPIAVETFEMFPHTSHVEVLLVLERHKSDGTHCPSTSGARKASGLAP